MLNNITNFFNLLTTRRIKTTIDPSDLVALGVYDPRTPGVYQPAAILACDLVAGGGGGSEIVVLATGLCSTLRCGNTNIASGNYATALGRCNTASSNYSTVSGGYVNTASARYSAVVGGSFNTSSNYGTTVLGGFQNTASGCYSGILGGSCNISSNDRAFIVGSNITSDRNCTTFVNALSMKTAPTSSAGLPAGTVWVDTAAGNVLKMVP